MLEIIMNNRRLSFLEEVYQLTAEIKKFFIENAIKIVPVTEPHLNTENFFIIDNFRYYLKPSDWDLVYNMIFEQRSQEEESLDSLQHKLVFSKLKDHIHSGLTIFADAPATINNLGRPSMSSILREYFHPIIKGNLELYSLTIYYSLHDRIISAIVKDKLTDNMRFQDSETSLSYAFGKAIINAYLNNDLYSILSTYYTGKLTELDSLAVYSNVWISCFTLFYAKGMNQSFSEKELKIIELDLKTYYSLTINQPVILRAIALIIINDGLYKYQKSKMGFYEIYNCLKTYNLDDIQIYKIQIYINEQLTPYYVSLGNLILNFFIDDELFINKTVHKDQHKLRIVELNESLVYNAYNETSIYRPFLTPDNVNMFNSVNIKSNVEGINVNYKIRTILDAIHFNPTGKGSMPESSIFKRNPECLQVRYTVDTLFLTTYLDFISPFLNNTIDKIADKDNLFLFLYFYNIDFLSLSNNIPKENHSLLDNLVNFAIDFNNFNDSQLEKSLKNLVNKNLSLQLKKIFFKIRSYKLHLRVTLSQLIIYANFGHFIMNSFFDFRGRRYFVGSTFNLQSYPYLRAFIKLFEVNNISPDNFLFFKEKLLNIVDNTNTRLQLNNILIDYDTYSKNLSDSINSYLYSFLDSARISREGFTSMLLNNKKKDITFWYSQIYTFIKKKDKALWLTSFILLELKEHNNNTYYVNTYGYDAVVSGYQMLSILFRSKSLGKMCNLTDNENKDLYLEVNHEFNNKLNCFSELLLITLNNILNISFQEFIALYKITDFREKLVNIESETEIGLLKHFLINDLSLYSMVEVQKILDLILEKLPLLKQVLRGFYFINSYWIIQHYAKRYISLLNKNKDYCILFIIKAIGYFKYIISNNNWVEEYKVLTKRELFKNALMIEIYGGKHQGRKKGFIQFFNDISMEMGKSLDNIQHIIPFLENFYTSYKQKHLAQTMKLKKIAILLSKKDKFIKITNPNYSFILAPLSPSNKPIRIDINNRRNKKPYRLTLLKSNIKAFNSIEELDIPINKAKMATVFLPNFVHSMDAMVVHLTIIKKESLREIKGNYFELTTTHDFFSMGKALFPIAPFIIKDCYQAIYSYNYLNTLKDNFQDAEFITILEEVNQQDYPDFMDDSLTNPNFIKY